MIGHSLSPHLRAFGFEEIDGQLPTLAKSFFPPLDYLLRPLNDRLIFWCCRVAIDTDEQPGYLAVFDQVQDVVVVLGQGMSEDKQTATDVFQATKGFVQVGAMHDLCSFGDAGAFGYEQGISIFIKRRTDLLNNRKVGAGPCVFLQFVSGVKKMQRPVKVIDIRTLGLLSSDIGRIRIIFRGAETVVTHLAQIIDLLVLVHHRPI